MIQGQQDPDLDPVQDKFCSAWADAIRECLMGYKLTWKLEDHFLPPGNLNSEEVRMQSYVDHNGRGRGGAHLSSQHLGG